MIACILPNSSKFDEFISSWIAFGSIFTPMVAVVPVFSVLNLNVSPPCSEIRANPSHLVVVVPGALHQLPLTKLVPR